MPEHAELVQLDHTSLTLNVSFGDINSSLAGRVNNAYPVVGTQL